ncbi:MAG TPA: hypothetical protein VNC39_15535 [Acidocella sp.]|uniref:hypothetical protein n=1 Tax=Acidocella sp. TaxID=50710 RepID=UPI002B61D6A9|nr:hypothetical protein [Acidocella sp.]HVE23383.1 hypothetical protein [Acidocella sp.]
MTDQNPHQIAAAIVKLADSGLFDRAWYEAQYGDLLAADSAALVQFCDVGWRRGLRPNLCFDPAHYLAVNADVREAGLNPLLHYLEYGEAETRWPGPHFDPEWYRATQGLAADQNGLADYLRRQRDASVNPNGGFDSLWYQEEYGHEIPPGLSPFEDYLRHGAAQGRDVSAAARFIRLSGAFDPDFYRRHHNPGTLDPVYHFCAFGWRRGYNPGPGFATRWYLEHNQDVAESGVNPFYQYLKCGIAQGRHPTPERPAPDDAAHDEAQLAASGLFDVNYYLAMYPDVRQSGVSAIRHFSAFGWREGRRPNPYFDTSWYALTYLPSPSAAMNPVLHYIAVGERNNCKPSVYFDPAWYRMEYRVPADELALRHFLEHRRAQSFSPLPWFDVARYMRAHGAEVGGNRDPFAHYLRVGITRDIDPGPDFNAALYRAAHMEEVPPRGRPGSGEEVHEKFRRERHNPLVHFLLRGHKVGAGEVM